MPTFSRRRILSRIAALAATEMIWKPSLLRALERIDGPTDAAHAPISLGLKPSWDETVATISPSMLGLSYESSQLSVPDFFSSTNTELINLFKRLSPHGVLRLGGNLSEYTRWTPEGVSGPSQIPFRAVTPDASTGKGIQTMPVTPTAIRNLRDFLDLTGWRVIYGLKLARARPERIVEEAKFVAQTLGLRLIVFQIGNEPNHYVLNRLRPPGYSFADYFAEWSNIHGAVSNAVPAAGFAGPDMAEDVSWVEQFAAVAPQSVVMLTGHHYAEGPPSDAAVTIEKLLAPNPSFDRHIEKLEAISRNAKMPYAMAETNTCYNAGKAGVSDVFASALWAVDYTMQLAQAGQSGVYFHGGGAGLYTPIAGGSGSPFEPRPIYYGLLFCRDLLGCAIARVEITTRSTANISVYATKQPRRIIAINKGSRDAVLQLPAREQAFDVLRLMAPSPESKTKITLHKLNFHKQMTTVRLPKFSAAVINLEQS